jgi:hypothetical protein
VTNTLHPPVIALVPDKQVHEQELLEFDIVATDPKIGETLTLTAENLPEGAQFLDLGNRTGHFQWTPSSEQPGQYDAVTFIATDTEGSTDSETMSILVLDGLAGCTPDWQCTDWSACADSFQTRVCTDQQACQSDSGRPAEVAACDSSIPERVVDLRLE